MPTSVWEVDKRKLTTNSRYCKINTIFELNLSNYNNGIYLIRVSQGANVATQTVLLAK